MNPEEFSRKLKDALRSKNMTQGQLCETIDMSMNGLKSSIDNDTLRIKTIREISKALDKPLSYFIEELEFEQSLKPEGYLKRMVDDVVKEAQEWRLKYYQAQEQIANFLKVSKYFASCGIRLFFWVFIHKFTNFSGFRL